MATAFQQTRVPEHEIQPLLVVMLEKLAEGRSVEKITEHDITAALPGLLNQASINQELSDALEKLVKVSPAAQQLVAGELPYGTGLYELPTFLKDISTYWEAKARACEEALEPKSQGAAS
jgi:hypothetical protein